MRYLADSVKARTELTRVLRKVHLVTVGFSEVRDGWVVLTTGANINKFKLLPSVDPFYYTPTEHEHRKAKVIEMLSRFGFRAYKFGDDRVWMRRSLLGGGNGAKP